MFATPIHNTYDFTLLKPNKPDLTLFTIETQPSFFLPSNTFSTGRICQFLACHPAGLRVLKSMETGDSDVIRTSPISCVLCVRVCATNIHNTLSEDVQKKNYRHQWCCARRRTGILVDLFITWAKDLEHRKAKQKKTPAINN